MSLELQGGRFKGAGSRGFHRFLVQTNLQLVYILQHLLREKVKFLFAIYIQITNKVIGTQYVAWLTCKFRGGGGRGKGGRKSTGDGRRVSLEWWKP